jgi:predicted PurR-regulated permease PerM
MNDEGKAGDAAFLRRLILALLVLGIAWLIWQLRFVMVLAFGAVLFAVILNALALLLQRRLHFPEKLSLTAAAILIFGALLAGFAMFGAELNDQADEITDALPAALAQGRALADALGIGEWVDQYFNDIVDDSAVSGSLGQILISFGDGLTNLIILIVGGIFLASKPQIYRVGLIKLVPPAGRSNAATALDDCDQALRLWLRARLLAMLLVGLLTGLGLWLIGVQSYLALAFLAALLEFIPFFGPLLAAIPAILLALLISPADALLVAALFLVVQQLEGNLISPIVQQHAVELPPALLLFSLLAFGLLFGLLGFVLAEPLTVAIFVLIKRLYVREALGTRTPMPGQDE